MGNRLDEEFPRDRSYIIQDALICFKLDAFIVAGSPVSVKQDGADEDGHGAAQQQHGDLRSHQR